MQGATPRRDLDAYPPEWANRQVCVARAGVCAGVYACPVTGCTPGPRAKQKPQLCRVQVGVGVCVGTLAGMRGVAHLTCGALRVCRPKVKPDVERKACSLAPIR